MTKGKFVSLVTSVLGGGIPVDDVKKKYHPQVIAANIEVVFSDIVEKNRDEFKTLLSYKSFNQEVKSVDGRDYIDFPVDGLGGFRGVKSVAPFEGAVSYGWVQNPIKSFMMQTLKGGHGRTRVYPMDGKIFFSRPTGESEVSVLMVPSVTSLSDDDELIVDGFGTELLNGVLGVLALTDRRIMDLINQQSEDARRRAN